MDPNDPTRIFPAAPPPGGEQAGWPPPPPGPAAWPAGHYDPAPAVAYPAAAPSGPSYRPTGEASYGGPVVPGSGRKRPSKGLLATGAVLALLVAGVIGFIVGVQVEKGRTSSTAAAGATSTTTPAALGGGAGGGANRRIVTGQVGAVNAGQFTITLADGSTATVAVSGSTRILRTIQGSLQNVAPGAQVTVTGPRAADGSITATVVTITSARGAGTGKRKSRSTTTLPAG